MYHPHKIHSQRLCEIRIYDLVEESLPTSAVTLQEMMEMGGIRLSFNPHNITYFYSAWDNPSYSLLSVFSEMDSGPHEHISPDLWDVYGTCEEALEMRDTVITRFRDRVSPK